MSKNALIGLGIVVVLLTAWLVIGVAYQSMESKEADSAKTTASTQNPEVEKSPTRGTTTSAVETTVDIANNQVETSVTVE